MIRTKVMQSAAGWYVGQEEKDESLGFWAPYDRLSNYFYSRWEAQLHAKLYCGVQEEIVVEKVVAEIDEELKRLKGNKHPLAAARKQFLLNAHDDLDHGSVPREHWNYSVNATPENAVFKG